MRFYCDEKMFKVTIFITVVCFTELIYCRPADAGFENDGEVEEVEYEEVKDMADPVAVRIRSKEYPGDSLKSDKFLVNLNKNSYLSRISKPRIDRQKSDMYEYKPYKKLGDENIGANERANNFDALDEREYMKYSQSKDETEPLRQMNPKSFPYLQNQLIHNEMLMESPHDKKEGKINEDGDLLFGYKKDDLAKNDRAEYNDQLIMNAEITKQFPTQFQNRAMVDNRHLLHFMNRERRETEDTNSQTNSENGKGNPIIKSDEDEQTAIRQHIKKLSNEELQELLNSLSEEKRALLKKIIDDSELNEAEVNKREITKKAQAIDGNSYSDQDISKGESLVTIAESSPTFSAETTETNKQAESKTEGLKEVAKPSETTNSALDNLQSKIEASNSNSDSKANAEIASNEPVTSKSDNKREVNSAELSDIAYEDAKNSDNNMMAKGLEANEGYRCPADDLNPYLDDEKIQSIDEANINKRDIDNQVELDSKMKSLEESFPSSDSYDESPGPLIRVKRTNPDSSMMKRSAGVLPDAKVAYVPYKAENDEDSEEGNEFDDDGFYDRNPNFCSSENKRLINDNKIQQSKRSASKSDSNLNDVNMDSNSLGTDTDGVLSGVDGGIDENLMCNTNSRDKRMTNENSDDANGLQNIEMKQIADKDMVDKFVKDPYYQENDSFGPLPHNYEGDLGRFKRIRRVKQSHADGTLPET